MSEQDYPKRIPPPDIIKSLAECADGTITECAVLPDGSGFAVMSMPLPKTHWIYEKAADGFSQPPPMPFRVGDDQMVSVTLTRRQFADAIWAAGKYAVRGATMHGAEKDFDPDALCQNLVVGMLGYWTADGLSGDAWANPPGIVRADVETAETVDARSSSPSHPNGGDRD